METAFPWYYYPLPQFIYTTFPFQSNRINTFADINSNQQKIDFTQNHEWLSLCYLQKENQPMVNHQFTPIAIKSPQTQFDTKNSQQELNPAPKRKFAKKQQIELNQYFPSRKTEENKALTTCLNEYRNILPNTIHQILSYVQRKNKSKSIVQRLIKKYVQDSQYNNEMEISSEEREDDKISLVRYYAFQNHLKNKLPNYVTLQTFKYLCTDRNIEPQSEIFSLKEQRIYSKICRTVILYYLKYEVVCVLMSSKRMQKDKKREHLKVNRRIESYIKSGFKEQMLCSDFEIDAKNIQN